MDGTAPLLQVATSGWWEWATAVRLPATDEDLARLVAESAGRDFAAEVLWEGPPIVFVGAYFEDVAKPPLRDLAARSDWTPRKALRVLAGDVPRSPVSAELGAVNAWRSVGPLALGLADRQADIEAMLDGRPDLVDCHRPVALEIGYDQPRRSWWAIEVSVRQRDRHRVESERVAVQLRSMTEGVRDGLG